MTRYERIKKMSIEEMAKSFNKNGIMTDEICREMSKCPYMDEYGDISDAGALRQQFGKLLVA